MAVVIYSLVESISLLGNKLHCNNLDTNTSFEVNGTELIEQMYSADRFLEEKKVTRTAMAEILMRSFNVPFKVEFIKADGKTKRTLRGRLVAPNNAMGRSQVEDLDKPVTDRYSQVDHRTISMLIVNGVKYTLKK
jgi:hypothetical protein